MCTISMYLAGCLLHLYIVGLCRSCVLLCGDGVRGAFAGWAGGGPDDTLCEDDTSEEATDFDLWVAASS